MEKKLTLLNCFKDYLQIDQKAKKYEKITNLYSHKEKHFQVYIKKWKSMKESMIFRMNNNIFQVFLKDKTQIIFSFDKKSITYQNLLCEKQHFPLSISYKCCDNAEILNKVNFAKELIVLIYKNNLQIMEMREKEKEKKKTLGNNFSLKTTNEEKKIKIIK